MVAFVRGSFGVCATSTLCHAAFLNREPFFTAFPVPASEPESFMPPFGSEVHSVVPPTPTFGAGAIGSSDWMDEVTITPDTGSTGFQGNLNHTPFKRRHIAANTHSPVTNPGVRPADRNQGRRRLGPTQTQNHPAARAEGSPRIPGPSPARTQVRRHEQQLVHHVSPAARTAAANRVT